MIARPAVVPPLEQLLAIPISTGDGDAVKLSYPEFFRTKFVRASKRKDRGRPARILDLRFVFDGSGEFRDVPLYELSEVGTIMLVEIKEPETITPTTFQGEIGERTMRATLDVLLQRAKEDHPGFDYRILRGDPRQIIGISQHELIAFGKFANIYVYQTLPASYRDDSGRVLLTNPLWSPDPRDITQRINTEFIKERFRGCFKDVKGEIDALIEWEYKVRGEASRRGLIVCETKTGVLRKQPSSDPHLADLADKLAVVSRVFPDRELSYLVMATHDYLYERDTLRPARNTKQVTVPSMKNIHQFLTARNIPLMLLGFQCNSDELFRQGQYILERYRQSHKSAGKFEWEDGRVRLDRNNGIMELNFGGRREIYRLNDQGNWVPFEQPQRP